MRKFCARLTGPITLLLLLTGFGASAAAPALNAAFELRPLTPQEQKEYSLSGQSLSAGLNTAGVGQPFYLEALANAALAPSNITRLTWHLISRPTPSQAVITNSPLPTGLPPYKRADRTLFQVAGRAMLLPDVSGQYSVQLTIETQGSGSTNITRALTAATYLGVQTCTLCHGPGAMTHNTYSSWTNTLHSHAFKDAITGLSTDHFAKNCISCHVVGYDTNAPALNGGFDDLAAKTGWLFPATLAGSNWNAMPVALRDLSNIQCESCHGPGSEHVYAFASTNVSNWPRIALSMGAGDCAQCHDSLSHHYKTAEWANSRHAAPTRTPSGPNRSACVQCHTAAGFTQAIKADFSSGTNTLYEAITCQACHDPHSAQHPHQLRRAGTFSLADGTLASNAGAGALCMQCHHARNGSAESNILNYQKGLPTWAGGSSFGVHDSPQADMLAGGNAITYGRDLPSASHARSVPDSCVGCHMQPVQDTDPAFTKAGGHTFSMTYDVLSAGATNTVQKVDVCVKCHGPITSFDLANFDYNRDGVVEGVQSEVKHLLDKLSTLLPNSAGIVDGAVKPTLSVRTNWSTPHLKAAYNWQFVKNDGSYGIHNAQFAVALLRASIGDLTGDSNADGLPDAWQARFFGSPANPDAAPDSRPSGDNVPNWLKYQLGLNPLIAGKLMDDGVLWPNSSPEAAPEGSLKIYTAAEVVFPTEPGKSYQLQAISPFSGWSDISTPVTGTGSPMSFSTPTRSGAQQYFRVLTRP